MADQDVENTIRNYFAAVSALDVEAWLKTMAPDVVCHDPADAPEIRGHAQLREFFNGLTAVFASVVVTLNHLIVCGRHAAVQWHVSGTGKNGARADFHGLETFVVDDSNRIQAIRAYWKPGEILPGLAG